MKTNYKFTEATTELRNFVPVEGTWETQHESYFDAQTDLEAAIEKEVGFPVVVQLFQSNGHAIVDEANAGNMLVTRATSQEIAARHPKAR